MICIASIWGQVHGIHPNHTKIHIEHTSKHTHRNTHILKTHALKHTYLHCMACCSGTLVCLILVGLSLCVCAELGMCQKQSSSMWVALGMCKKQSSSMCAALGMCKKQSSSTFVMNGAVGCAVLAWEPSGSMGCSACMGPIRLSEEATYFSRARGTPLCHQ